MLILVFFNSSPASNLPPSHSSWGSEGGRGRGWEGLILIIFSLCQIDPFPLLLLSSLNHFPSDLSHLSSSPRRQPLITISGRLAFVFLPNPVIHPSFHSLSLSLSPRGATRHRFNKVYKEASGVSHCESVAVEFKAAFAAGETDVCPLFI